MRREASALDGAFGFFYILEFIVGFLVCIPLTYLEIIGGNDENHNDNARLDG